MVAEELENYLNTLPVKKFLILTVLFAIPLLILPRFAVIGAFILLTFVTAYTVGFSGLRWTGIELATFFTVVIGSTETPLLAGLFGLILVVGQMISGGWSGLYLLWVVPSYFFAGVVASILGASQVAVTGIGITVGLHVVFTSFTFMFNRDNVGQYLVYAVLNLTFNAMMFLFVSNPVLSVIT